MSLSHSPENQSTNRLSGAEALRNHFNPRQRLRLKEAAQCVGLSYSRFFRRVQAGTLGLRVRKDEIGERFVLLDDLISYIFPPSETETISSSSPAKKKVGRPRKPVAGDGGRMR